MTLDRRTALALVPSAAAVSLAWPAEATAGHSDEIDRLLRQQKVAYDLRSVMLAVWVGEREIYARALGRSRDGERARLGMHFRAAVVMTTYLNALALWLSDRGRLDLDAPIHRWLPGLPKARKVTVRMLGLNSSGYGDYLDSEPFASIDDRPFLEIDWIAAELIRLGTSLQMAFEPGTGFHYAHTNAVILGEVLQRATGRPLAQLIRQAFLDPYGLHQTEVPTGYGIRRPVLHAFSSEYGRYEDSTHYNPSWVSWSGWMNSTLRDIGRWARLLGSGAFLSRESYRALIAPTNVGRNGNEADLYFGLGVIVANGWITQNGRYFGWNPVIAYLPSKGVTIAAYTTFGPRSADLSHALRIVKEAVKILTPKHPIPERYT